MLVDFKAGFDSTDDREPVSVSTQPENSDSDEDENSEMKLNPGTCESLLLPEDNLIDMIIKMAPAENNIPLSLLFDNNAEVLSFPSIYGGVPRRLNQAVKLTDSDIAKSEARNYDSRGRKPTKIFFSFLRLRQIQIISQIRICLRKKKRADGTPITAGQLLNRDFVEGLIQHDDGFRMLKNIRSSPAYWGNQKKKALAMIRQLGKPAFFITLSAAETKWNSLLRDLFVAR